MRAQRDSLELIHSNPTRAGVVEEHAFTIPRLSAHPTEQRKRLTGSIAGLTSRGRAGEPPARANRAGGSAPRMH